MTLALLRAQLGMVLGHLAERLQLPPIAGQLTAGVVLGPTVFGAALPRLYATLWPAYNALLNALLMPTSAKTDRRARSGMKLAPRCGVRGGVTREVGW
jgi:Kef-type K+ transport system membrane component KefB